MSKKVKDMTPEEIERKRERERRYREANRDKDLKRKKRYHEENRERNLVKQRQYYRDNIDEELKRRKRYREANKEKIREGQKRHREANREKCLEHQKRYREANKEKIREGQKRHREANREKCLERQKRYREDNKDLIESKIKSDPNKMIARILRNRFTKAFNRKSKTGSGVADLGMSIDEFRVHIESMFDEFMTWENRGSYWQFDHIYPLDKANLRDRVEFLAVANWRNYQPLEAGENIRKKNKVTPKARRLFESLKKEFSS